MKLSTFTGEDRDRENERVLARRQMDLLCRCGSVCAAVSPGFGRANSSIEFCEYLQNYRGTKLVPFFIFIVTW